MIDSSIRNILLLKHSQYLDFNALVSFMEATGIDYRDRHVRGSLALATSYCIYLDIKQLLSYPDKFLYFVIIHETAHNKRIQKVGLDKIIEKLSIGDFDMFFNFVVEEEIAADRYGCFVFQQLTKTSYPREATQQLHLPIRQWQYRPIAASLFGVVQNNKASYIALMESFVYET
jgi:hypothetical protein